jgi:membrane protein DedA with SNARE-associated domain
VPGAAIVGAVLTQLALHVHHFHGPRVDLDAVALAAAATWVGVPGVGEAVLIGAGIAASRGHPDIASVILFAWVGANVGGVAGWLVGRQGGRRVALAGRWLKRARRRGLEQGERFFDRYGWLAVYVAPSWVAGINRMSPVRFAAANAAWALVWALGLGLGSYAIGPSVRDIWNDVGLIGTLAIVVAVLVVLLLTRLGMRRRRGGAEESP